MLVPYQSWDLFLLSISCANRATHLFRRHEHYTETRKRKILRVAMQSSKKRACQETCANEIERTCAARNMDGRTPASVRKSKQNLRNSHTWWGPCWKADVLTFCDDWGKMRRSELLTDSPSRCLPLTSESAGACSSAGGWAGGWMAGGSFS